MFCFKAENISLKHSSDDAHKQLIEIKYHLNQIFIVDINDFGNRKN